jgi:hypothetical protein
MPRQDGWFEYYKLRENFLLPSGIYIFIFLLMFLLFAVLKIYLNFNPAYGFIAYIWTSAILGSLIYYLLYRFFKNMRVDVEKEWEKLDREREAYYSQRIPDYKPVKVVQNISDTSIMSKKKTQDRIATLIIVGVFVFATISTLPLLFPEKEDDFIKIGFKNYTSESVEISFSIYEYNNNSDWSNNDSIYSSQLTLGDLSITLDSGVDKLEGKIFNAEKCKKGKSYVIKVWVNPSEDFYRLFSGDIVISYYDYPGLPFGPIMRLSPP